MKSDTPRPCRAEVEAAVAKVRAEEVEPLVKALECYAAVPGNGTAQRALAALAAARAEGMEDGSTAMNNRDADTEPAETSASPAEQRVDP